MKPHRTYTLEQYNPEWKVTFKEVSNRIKNIMGETALEIEHIGSTSIEGMVAKPQIDILVVVENLELIKVKYQEMLEAGFTHHGRGYINEDDDYFSLNTSEGKRIASIHILQKANEKIDHYLIFRDYLRTHAKERDLYISVKKSLYLEHSDNYSDYDLGKKDVILGIRERAINWSKTVD